MSKHQVVWLDRGGLPNYWGFCPSKKAWDAELKKLKCDPAEYPTASGHCAHFNSPSGRSLTLVTIAENVDVECSPAEIVGLLAHEGAHVWQETLRAIGEEAPSPEFEAYAIQRIVQDLVKTYEKTRRKLFR